MAKVRWIFASLFALGCLMGLFWSSFYLDASLQDLASYQQFTCLSINLTCVQSNTNNQCKLEVIYENQSNETEVAPITQFDFLTIQNIETKFAPGNTFQCWVSSNASIVLIKPPSVHPIALVILNLLWAIIMVPAFYGVLYLVDKKYVSRCKLDTKSELWNKFAAKLWTTKNKPYSASLRPFTFYFLFDIGFGLVIMIGSIGFMYQGYTPTLMFCSWNLIIAFSGLFMTSPKYLESDFAIETKLNLLIWKPVSGTLVALSTLILILVLLIADPFVSKVTYLLEMISCLIYLAVKIYEFEALDIFLSVLYTIVPFEVRGRIVEIEDFLSRPEEFEQRRSLEHAHLPVSEADSQMNMEEVLLEEDEEGEIMEESLIDEPRFKKPKFRSKLNAQYVPAGICGLLIAYHFSIAIVEWKISQMGVWAIMDVFPFILSWTLLYCVFFFHPIGLIVIPFFNVCNLLFRIVLTIWLLVLDSDNIDIKITVTVLSFLLDCLLFYAVINLRNVYELIFPGLSERARRLRSQQDLGIFILLIVVAIIQLVPVNLVCLYYDFSNISIAEWNYPWGLAMLVTLGVLVQNDLTVKMIEFGVSVNFVLVLLQVSALAWYYLNNSLILLFGVWTSVLILCEVIISGVLVAHWPSFQIRPFKDISIKFGTS